MTSRPDKDSYALPEDPSSLRWPATDVPLYTRNSGANQIALQEKLAALDNGEDAVVLASGAAAMHAVLFRFLSSGDHVVVGDVTYEATFRLFSELLPQKYAIEATFVDSSNVAAQWVVRSSDRARSSVGSRTTQWSMSAVSSHRSMPA